MATPLGAFKVLAMFIFQLKFVLLFIACLPSRTTSQMSSVETESCGKPAIEPSVFSNKRILGGEGAVAGSWPWQIRIGEKVKGGISFFCGGTILNPYFVVTAGHCFPGSPNSFDPRKYVIRVAEHNMTVSEDVERDYSVSWIYRHPYYASVGSPSNDIALVRLTFPMTFTTRVSGICLPPPESDPEPGRHCVVTGWGRYVDQFKVMNSSKPIVSSSSTQTQSASTKPTNVTFTNPQSLSTKQIGVTFTKFEGILAKNPTESSTNSIVRLTNRTTAPSTMVSSTTASSTVTSSSSPSSSSRPVSQESLLSFTGKNFSGATTEASWNVLNKDMHGNTHVSRLSTPSTSLRTTTGKPQNSTTTGIPKPPSPIITSGNNGHIYKPLHGPGKSRRIRRLQRVGMQRSQISAISVHAEVLQQAVLPIFDRKNCSTYWKTLLRDNMICTFPPHTSAEPCKGDSGGPLVCRNGDGPDAYWTLDGIISFGAGCGGKKPAVYTRVSSFLRWIEKTAKSSNSVQTPSLNPFPFFSFPANG